MASCHPKKSQIEIFVQTINHLLGRHKLKALIRRMINLTPGHE